MNSHGVHMLPSNDINAALPGRLNSALSLFGFYVFKRARSNRDGTIFLFFAVLLQAATTYKVIARYPVPGDGGFDYVTIDSAARHIYISHGAGWMSIDADAAKSSALIPDTPGVHGAAIAPEFSHRFTSKGR